MRQCFVCKQEVTDPMNGTLLHKAGLGMLLHPACAVALSDAVDDRSQRDGQGTKQPAMAKLSNTASTEFVEGWAMDGNRWVRKGIPVITKHYTHKEIN